MRGVGENEEDHKGTLMLLNAAALIEHFPLQSSLWSAVQDSMLRKIEQLNVDLLRRLNLEVGPELHILKNEALYTGLVDSSQILRSKCKNESNLLNKGPETEISAFRTSVLPKGRQNSHGTKTTLASVDVNRNMQSDAKTGDASTEVLMPSGSSGTACRSGRSKKARGNLTSSTSYVSTANSSIGLSSGRGSGPCENIRQRRRAGRFTRGGSHKPRGNPNRGRGMPHFHPESSSLSSSSDSSVGLFGFTKEEEEELLCQGIKPWDPEAWDALAVLNGSFD